MVLRHMVPAFLARKVGRAMRTDHMSKMVNRLFYTKLGQVFISILFGVSLALMFHQACKGRKCMIYVSPPSKDINGKIYEVGGKCYQYVPDIVPCTNDKTA